MLLTCKATAQQGAAPEPLLSSPWGAGKETFFTLVSAAPNCLVMLLHAGSVNYPFDEMLIQLPHLVKQLKGTQSGTVPSPDTRHNAAASPSAPSVQAPVHATDAAAPSDEVQQLSGGQAAHANALDEQASIIVLCRRGNDSQLVVQSLREHGLHAAVDLTGGLAAWAQHAGTNFPRY